MISAQVDQVMQEHLIEKYMMLPNQVWDDIISQASKVRALFGSCTFSLAALCWYALQQQYCSRNSCLVAS
jgi:hypothetical protein